MNACRGGSLDCHLVFAVDEKQSKINANNDKVEYIYCEDIIDAARDYLACYACYITNQNCRYKYDAFALCGARCIAFIYRNRPRDTEA